MILVFQYLHLNMSVAMTLFMASSYKMPVVCSEFNHNRYKMIKWNYLSLFFLHFYTKYFFFFSSCIFIWFYAWAQYHLMEHAHRIRQHKSTITITITSTYLTATLMRDVFPESNGVSGVITSCTEMACSHCYGQDIFHSCFQAVHHFSTSKYFQCTIYELI